MTDISTELDIPMENLLTPDFLRRVAWTPPVPATAQTIGDALAALIAHHRARASLGDLVDEIVVDLLESHMVHQRFDVGDGERPGSTDREGHRGGDPEALSHQGKGDRGAHGGRRSGPDGQPYRSGWPRVPPHRVGEYRSAGSGQTASAPLAVIRMAPP